MHQTVLGGGVGIPGEDGDTLHSAWKGGRTLLESSRMGVHQTAVYATHVL